MNMALGPMTANLTSEVDRRLALLQCPACSGRLTLSSGLVCRGCDVDYYDSTAGLIRLLGAADMEASGPVRAFWGDTYKQWYEADEERRTAAQLQRQLDLLEQLLRARQHLAVTEMPLEDLRGKNVLEVGSGAGGHSALFRKHGAHVTAVDVTPERVAATQRKLDLLHAEPDGSGLAIQATAERLPFVSSAFDIVYSNGVLHHSRNAARCVQEVFRVTKPGGIAIVMLYSRASAYYWLTLIPIGIATGRIFRLPRAEWAGQSMEGTPRHQRRRNPYSWLVGRRELLRLFGPFASVELRKNGFLWSHVPPLWWFRDPALRAFGYRAHEGGRIVYGAPMIPETRLELWLGRHIGLCWNIRARKV